MWPLQFITTQSEGREKVAGGRETFAKSSTALANLDLCHLPETEVRDEATTEEKDRKDNTAVSSCCSFKWVPPANSAGVIIQLLACTQAKPGRLVHLHKPFTKTTAHATTHRMEPAHKNTTFAIHFRHDGFNGETSLSLPVWCLSSVVSSNLKSKLAGTDRLEWSCPAKNYNAIIQICLTQGDKYNNINTS